jgi:hypothetical protein
VESEEGEEKRGELAKTAALTFLEMNRLIEAVEMLEAGRRAGGGAKSTKDIEDTMAAMFIGNSALWLDPSVTVYFATVDGIEVAEDFCAYLAKSLEKEEGHGWRELLAYAKASVEFGILNKKESAEVTIREHILVGGLTKPSADETKTGDTNSDFISSFKVLTVATEIRPALNNLIRSAKLGFANYEVLGLGMEWEGNPMKVRLYLEEVRMDDRETRNAPRRRRMDTMTRVASC